jgi:hypothetical protein
MNVHDLSSKHDEPLAGRPHRAAESGISTSPEGLLPWSWAEERLKAAHTYWVCTVTPNGHPHAMPLWGIWHEGTLYFSTSRSSRKGRNLAANPRVVIHIESGDEAVIVEEEAREANDGEALHGADAAYAAKYVDAETGESYRLNDGPPGAVVYAVQPRVAFGFRERDFPTSATRWTFAAS